MTASTLFNLFRSTGAVFVRVIGEGFHEGIVVDGGVVVGHVGGGCRPAIHLLIVEAVVEDAGVVVFFLLEGSDGAYER